MILRLTVVLLKDDDDEEALETELFTNIGENQVGSGGWGILNMNGHD